MEYPMPIQSTTDPAYNRVRALMRNEAVYRPPTRSKGYQRPAGKSSRPTRYIPGTPEYDALLASRRAS